MRKRFLAVAVCIAALSAIAGGCSTGVENTGIGETGISLEEFENIHSGMTLDKVRSIVGGEGILVSESKEEDETGFMHTYTYKFDGETGGYAEFEFSKYNSKDILKMSFDDPELTQKTQFDLK